MRCLVCVLAALAALLGTDGARGFTGVEADDGPVTVWAVGDGAVDVPATHALAARIERGDPDRVLYLGDVYETGTAAEFRSGMRGVYGAFLRRILPTPGNHEWPNHAVGYDPFWERVTGAPTPRFYRVRLGSWELLSLNTEAPHGPGSAQLRWLRRQLDAPAACRIVMMHRPRFSAGTHGDQPDLEPIWDAVAGRAALVLSGHDHSTQRFEPVRGTTQVVAGAGGRNHYPVRPDPRLVFADDDTDAALRLRLDEGRARATVVSTAGRVLDRFTARC